MERTQFLSLLQGALEAPHRPESADRLLLLLQGSVSAS